MTTILVILFILGFIWLLIWATSNMLKQSQKDWQTLEDLEKRAGLLKTKKEIEDFHKEFIEKAATINNSLISPRLSKIDGYIKGLYKQFQNSF